jgi:hypothetical protein
VDKFRENSSTGYGKVMALNEQTIKIIMWEGNDDGLLRVTCFVHVGIRSPVKEGIVCS